MGPAPPDSAALYAARGEYQALLIEGLEAGGQSC